MLTMGELIRDKKIWQYPIMPEAVMVFQQLASMREWAMSGPAKGVARGVEWLHKTQTIDPYTGFVTYGYDNFLKLRALDYAAVGRTAMAMQGTSDDAPLEYLDPVMLSFNRSNSVYGNLTQARVTPVRPSEKVWWYANQRQLRADEVVIHHPYPIGARGLFISPLLPLLPIATLAWLLREHDMAAIDGRKIREILFVGNVHLENAIEEAITIQAALWSGASPEEVGIPVVEVNNPSGQPIENYIARLGISQIPDAFSREEFRSQYANEIAAALGLALRHFWTDGTASTNRAVEIVQEQRQQQKGPSTFVRMEQRLLNQSGFLKRFGNRDRDVRFAFVEETDTASMKDRAEILERHANALEKINAVFGTTIEPKSYIAWMQSQGVLPNELELVEGAKMEDAARQESGEQMNTGDDKTQTSDPAPTTLPDVVPTSASAKSKDGNQFNLDYDEITMNGSGQIIERRVKVFSVVDLIGQELRKENAERAAKEAEAEAAIEEALTKTEPFELENDLGEYFEQAVQIASQDNQLAARRLSVYQESEVSQWLRAQKTFPYEEAEKALRLCLGHVVLNEAEQKVIDELVKAVPEAEWVSHEYS